MLVCTVGFGGCDRTEPAIVVPPTRTARSEQLGPGDLVKINVGRREDLSADYQVADDGTIRFPWIGAVAVDGKSPQAVASDIEARLADGWLRSPQVTVLVEQRQNREVSVIGQVNTPGSYPYKDRLTLVQAISLAGGMNPLAQARRVKLIRDSESGRQTYEIDVNAIIDSKISDFVLQPGDVVFVPESPI